MPVNFKNILIINPFGIGDVLFSTPLIESLSGQLAGCRIGFMCNRRTEGLLKDNPKIDRLFVYEKDELRELWNTSKIRYIRKLISFLSEIQAERFDVAIDLSLNREFGFLALLAGIPRRIGFNYKNRGIFLTDKIGITGYEDKHIVKYYLEILKYFDLKPLTENLTIHISESDKNWASDYLSANSINYGDKIIAVVPGGGASWGKDARIKHLKGEKFSEAADLLAEKLGAKILILGSPSEKDICLTVENNMRNRPINACGKTTVMQSAALMKDCVLVIANDGGPLHLAVAAGTRTVGIFGPVDERVYGQFPPGTKHKIVTSDTGCRPCYRNFRLKECDIKRCLDGISSQDIYTAAMEALGP